MSIDLTGTNSQPHINSRIGNTNNRDVNEEVSSPDLLNNNTKKLTDSNLDKLTVEQTALKKMIGLNVAMAVGVIAVVGIAIACPLAGFSLICAVALGKKDLAPLAMDLITNGNEIKKLKMDKAKDIENIEMQNFNDLDLRNIRANIANGQDIEMKTIR
tara:strand:+ start:2943 stop:3416 length:474 start_codon:yes stop_codon:yes gene_type:complete